MAITVLDSSNLDAIVTDATGEGLPQPEPKPEPKAEAKPEAKHEDGEDPADVEGEDGLTAREKQELTAKMLKAVGKRVRQAREAEEFATEQYNLRIAAERRAQELEQRLKAPPQAEPEPKANERPDRRNFSTDDEYIQAVIQHGVNEALAKKAAEEAKAAAEQRKAEVLSAAKARIARAIELVPDFEDVCNAADVKLPDHVAGYMQESEMFAELGYFLAQNPEVVEALNRMKPAKQLVEIGKIESKLQPFGPASKPAAKDGPKPSKETTAPQASSDPTEETQSAARRAAPVINPLSMNGSGSAEASMENVRDHIAEFARKRGANLLRRQRH